MTSNPVSEPDASTIISRYSRQMLVPELGSMAGQRALCTASVLIVGAGGIGVTAIMYLAGAGIGTIGIADFDIVDASNLHRQIIYSMDQVGRKKCECAAERVRALNPTCTVLPIDARVDCTNALEIVSSYDVVVDATDNFQVRYVLNDACVLAGKPLVSGAAVGLEGQATVYAPSLSGSGCYRCVNPLIHRAEACRSCADAGVLGSVPGLIGCLLSIEAIKVLRIVATSAEEGSHHTYSLSSHTSSSSSSSIMMQPLLGRQVYFDARSSSFHEFKLPPRSDKCAVCGPAPTIRSLEDTEAWLVQCLGGVVVRPKLLDARCEVTAKEYNINVLSSNKPHVLLDVRSAAQYSMINISKQCQDHGGSSLHIPWKEMSKKTNETSVQASLQIAIDESSVKQSHEGPIDIYILCRRGNDSIHATNFIISQLCESPEGSTTSTNTSGATAASSTTTESEECRLFNNKMIRVFNIRGGLQAWSSEVDTEFPVY